MNALAWFSASSFHDIPTVAEPFKACGCGRHFTRAEWDALPSIGLMASDRDGFDLDLRNCPTPCGSTISVEVPCRCVSPVCQ